jgi:TonB family protein
MKKIVITIILLASVCAHAQTDDKATLKEINLKLVESYKNNKFDDALKFANQAVELSLKIYGADNTETAVAYSNLGFVQREKFRYKDSTMSFLQTVAILEKLKTAKSGELIKSYEELALSQFLNGNKEESILSYLKAIEISEAKFGKNGKEVFSPTLDVANIYAQSKKYKQADEYYLKSYALAWKNFGKEAKETIKIEDARICAYPHQIQNDKDISKIFNDSKGKLFREIFGESVNFDNSGIIDIGFVNGKAISLPKPVYPLEAREKRLQGEVSIRVFIDEKGNVTDAKPVCGNGILETASIEAAKKCKFSPSILNGKAIKVTGTITYNFVP